MSYVYILTQTDYKHYEDFESGENKDLDVLYVFTTAKAANEAAKSVVKEYFSDGDNECEQDEQGCDTWTCTLEDRDDQSHVVVSILRKDLFDEPDEGEIDGEGASEDDKQSGRDERLIEAREPPTKRARQA